MDLFTLFATIGLKDDGFNKGMDDASQSGEGFASKIGGALKGVAGVASKAMDAIVKSVAAASTALYGLGAAAVKIGADFESEMANVAAITGMTSGEIKKMGDGIRDISKRTGKDVLELAANVKMVAEAGGDMDMMMSQLEHGTNLALASQTDMATTLDFLGSAMKTFGLEAEDTQGVVDSFAYVTTLANTTITDLSYALTNVGGSAAQAGMSIDDVNAVLVTFSNAGLKGGSAGTSLNAILRNLSTPTDKAATAFDNLNISLYDSEGASRDMFDIMSDLEVALSGMSDELRNQYEAAIFDSVALKGWNMITAEGIDNIAELSDELSSATDGFGGIGQAAGMAAKQSDTLKGTFSKIKTAAQDLGIAFYENVQNPLGEVAEKGLEYVQELSDAFSEDGLGGMVAKLGGIFADAITYIAEQAPMFVQTGLNLLGSLIQGLTENKDEIISGAMAAFTAFIDGIKELLPQLVPLAADIIMALVEGLIDTAELLLTTGPEIIASLLKGISDKLPELIPKAKEAIMNIVAGLKENLPEILKSGIEIISQLALGIAETLPDLIPEAVDAILLLVLTLIENSDKMIDAAFALMTGLMDGVMNAVPLLLEKAPEIIMKLVEALIHNLPKVLMLSNPLFMAIYTAIKKFFPDLGDSALEIIQNLAKGIINNVGEFISSGIRAVQDFVTNLIKTAKEEIPKFIQNVITFFEELPGKIGFAIGFAIGKIIKWVISLIETAKIEIPKFIDNVITFFKELPGKIWNAIVGAAKKIVEWATDLISTAKTEIPKFVTAVWDAIKGLPDKFLSIGKDIVEGIWDGIKSMVGWVTDKVKDFGKGLLDGLKSALGISSPSKVFRDEVGKMIAQGVAVGINDDAEKASKAAEKMSKMTYDNAVLWIKDYRNSTGYLLSEELAMWEILGENYSEVSKQKVEIDSNINKLRENLRKEEEASIKKHNEDTYGFSENWINARKALNLLTMQEEIEAWQRVSERYAEGTKQREDADKNLAKAREELRKAEMSAIAEMEKLEKDYSKALENKVKELFNAFNMFNEVKLQETNVAKNAKKLEETQAAYDKLKESLKNVEKELKNVELSSEKQEPLLEKQKELAKQLADAENELANAKSKSAKSQAQIMAENLSSQIDEMTKWGENIKALAEKGIDEGLLAELENMGPSANSYLQQLLESSNEELSKLSELYREKQALARKLAIDELSELRKETDNKISEILSDLEKKMSSDTNPIGQNMIRGIIDGALSMSGELNATLTYMAMSAAQAARDALQISSPSRIFSEMGSFIGEGFIIGVESMSGAVSRAMDDVFGNLDREIDVGIAAPDMPAMRPSNMGMNFDELIAGQYDLIDAINKINTNGGEREISMSIDGNTFGRVVLPSIGWAQNQRGEIMSGAEVRVW